MNPRNSESLQRLRALLPNDVLLHVGMTKAGSTAIQNTFLKNNVSLLNNRILFPKSVFGRANPFFPHRTAGHRRFIVQGSEGDQLDEFLTEARLAEGHADRLVLSAENVLLDFEDTNYLALRDLLEGKNLDIFCIVRSQTDWCESIYTEAVVKGFHREKLVFENFVDGLVSEGKLHYYERLKYLANALRARQVTVVDYDVVKNKGGAVRAALRVMGIDADLPHKISEDECNISAAFPEAIEAHRRLNSLTGALSASDYMAWCAAMEKAAAAFQQERGLRNSHARVGRKLAQRILDACVESNRKLSEEFLDGKSFGPNRNVLKRAEPPPLDEKIVGELITRGADLLVPYLNTSGGRSKQQGTRLKQLEKELANEQDWRSGAQKALDAAKAQNAELNRLSAANAKGHENIAALQSALDLRQADIERAIARIVAVSARGAVTGRRALEAEEKLRTSDAAIKEMKIANLRLREKQDGTERRLREAEESLRVRDVALEEMKSANLRLAERQVATERRVREAEESLRSRDVALEELKSANLQLGEQQVAAEHRVREAEESLRSRDAAFEELKSANLQLAREQAAAEHRVREMEESLRARDAALEKEKSRLSKIIKTIRADLDSRIHQMEVMQASASWRITRPLRTLNKNVFARWRNRDGLVRRTIAGSSLFDPQWYLTQNPDVAAAGVDPLLHYTRWGAFEGRDPGPNFSSGWYLSQNPDVAAKGINPLYHYLLYGAKEGRAALLSPNVEKAPTPKLKRHTASGKAKVPSTTARQVAAELSLPSARGGRKAQAALLLAATQELSVKLWGGFAEITIPNLTAIMEMKSEPAEVRAAAAWELCRYYMSVDDIPKAAALISQVRRLSKASMRNLRRRLVEIELLTMTGKMAEAQARLSACSAIPAYQSNAALGVANLINRQDRANKKLAIFTTINEMFEREGFSPLSCRDGLEGPLFAQLECDTSTLRFIDEPQRISVLVSAFNAEQHVELAIGSLQHQTWRNLEIIVVDDASTDRTFEIATRIAESDPRVKVIRNEVNMGAYPSRNRALAEATGDIVTVHDSDDWSHPEMLERQAMLLLSNPTVHGTFSMMCRATEDLIFQLRPSREVLEFIHRSYPSLMMTRDDVVTLGGWDGVRANADDEFIQRARQRFGTDAFADVSPAVPLSIFLTHDRSLTRSADTSLRSLTFGVRHEYSRSAAHWYKSQEVDGEPIVMPRRTDRKTPFPCPELLLPQKLRGSGKYDIILISDLSLRGGTRSCNLGYVDTALAMGLKVGMFHWPRGDLKLLRDVAPEYRERNKHERCAILTWEEEVEARSLIIHHPPILKYSLDRLPRIATGAVYVLVNQLPRQVTQQVEPYYSIDQVNRDLEGRFGHPPVWIAISSLTQRVLKEYAPDIRLLDEIWYPPYHGELSRTDFQADRNGQYPVLGRHGRDHWTKWPSDRDEIAAAYCAQASMQVRILGGARLPLSKLGKTPSNWELFPFDSLPVPEFLRGLDIYVNFNNRDYIEEFGRNCMEAMACGIPVIAAPVFTETFGDAIVPTEPANVQERAEELWTSKQKYLDQAERGYAFVEANCVASEVRKRLERMF